MGQNSSGFSPVLFMLTELFFFLDFFLPSFLAFELYLELICFAEYFLEALVPHFNSEFLKLPRADFKCDLSCYFVT